MDDFCGSQFWDTNLTWGTESPRFTPCFEKTVLVWVPCAFLWIFSLVETSYILHSKDRDIRWNWLNISKFLVTYLLVILTIVEVSFALHKSSEEFVPDVEYYTPVIKIGTFILSSIILIYNKKYGLRSSGLLFLFWLLLTLGAIPQLRSGIIDFESEETLKSFIIYIIYFILIIIMLVLNCFVDAQPNYLFYMKSNNPCPERNCSFLQRILYTYLTRLVYLGYKRTLVMDDMWSLNQENKSSYAFSFFNKYWDRSLKKIKNNDDSKKANSAKQISILPALAKAFGWVFLFGAFLKLIEDVIAFVSPQLLSLLITFVDGNEYVWKGYLYAVSMFVVGALKTLIESQYLHRMNNVGFRIRSSLMCAVYRKSLRLSNSARKQFTVGEIVNLMSVDAQRFMDLMMYINMIWSGPLQIALALYFLWQILGPSSLAGLAVMILLIPINGFLSSKTEKLQTKQMKNKDERVKMMNEILNGMKVLKLYAWEKSFEAQVLKIREKELKVIKQHVYYGSAMTILWSCAPFLVSLVTFSVFLLSDSNNVLDSKTAFVSISLFNILKFPLTMLPLMIMYLVQTLVSVKRINKFMNADELDPKNVEHDSSEVNPVIIENGSFSWDEEEPILKNINIKVAPGSLVAVVGSVGAGKSSLISALLGDINKLSGRVNTFGSIGYVPQQAWIQNCTLRDNILFGKAHDDPRYQVVVNACALKPDLEMLSAGDKTEIGEKGINLSGGQKQRVSLARAVYSESDIYLLDDPLSAVDSHVGKHIFDQVIGPLGLLKGKTRVLVTHSVTYLQDMDNIIVMKNGEVSEMGTYKQLLEKKGAFADFLIQHLNSEEDNAEELKLQLESTLGSSELINKLQRARSVSESPSETDRKTVTDLPATKSKSIDDDKLIEEEKAETGSVKWQVYSHYIASFSIFLAVVTVIANIFNQAFSIGSNVWLAFWSTNQDSINNNQSDPSDDLDLYLGVYTSLGIGQAISAFIEDLSPQLGCLTAAKVMHEALLRGILRSPMSFFDTTPIGRILSRFSKDIDTLDWKLPFEISTSIFSTFQVFGTILVISVSTPIFITVIIPIVVLYYFIQRFYISSSRQLKRLESISRSPIFSQFGESVSGATTIRAYKVQERFINESESRVDNNQACYYPSLLSDRWLAIRLETLGNLIIFFAALFAVLGRESLSPGIVGLSVSYALQITDALNWLVLMISEVEADIVAAERVKEYAENVTEAPWEIASTSPRADWPTEGAVKIDKLVMQYRSNTDPVLHGITCEIKAGEKVGIVGRTGAGKSTLTLALFRILEASSGKISIDGIDISTLGLHSLRSRLTIIPQDPVLFSGSLRMNLDPFDSFSDSAVWQALERAHLKVFVQSLAAGLNHYITEGGENLSVGQRQLVCLARALLRKTKVLVLDEATAAVDLETDDLIQQTIRKEFANCTILTIAHRLNTIMDSNRVLVLDKGRISEFDVPANLLQNKNSLFYSMAKDANIVK